MFLFNEYQAEYSPSVAKGDQELRFETRLQKQKLKITFDLRKMTYQGKMEF